MANPVGQGLKDLVLMAAHLALTIHEIGAHATEVDRIAGYEANYAGTSFVKISDTGKLKYGSKHFNVTADRTFPTGMATVGFDDDGVKAEMAAREGRGPRRAADQSPHRPSPRRKTKARLPLPASLGPLADPPH